MSADLFAEFSAGPEETGNQPKPSFSLFDDLTGASQPPAAGIQPSVPQTSSTIHTGALETNGTAANDDTDDWGDFEDSAPTYQPTASSVKQDPFSFSVSQSTQPSWSTAPAQSDPFSFISSSQVQTSQEGWTKAPVFKAKKSADPSVLFDAEDDFGDDDDFGDFEGSNPTPPIAPASSATVDLLGDLSFAATVPPQQQRAGTAASGKTTSSPPKRNSLTRNLGSMPRTKEAIKPKSKPATVSAPPSAKEEDAWDTFDDWEATIPTKAPEPASSKPKGLSATVLSPILSPTQDGAKAGELPPTNVPPPAVLLTLFPPLFTEAQNQLFKPMAAQALPMRNKLLAEPATIAYLQGYLMLASVAAHIIAGRKLRWKRDQHLSQGMRIGPASSRATSGMKLSSVDKSENMKEEREASDVVLAWKDQIGRLRHVVSAVNQIKAGTLGAVPDLQETMAVKALKQAEGGIPAPQACMMCGLKREERVGAADQGVEDSFGEWWIDQVNMHRGCRNFWNQHRDKLKQR